MGKQTATIDRDKAESQTQMVSHEFGLALH